MGKQIGKYDIELAERLEKIRKRNSLSQEEMAFMMATDVGTYKRFIYNKSKVPVEKIALLADELDLDLNYVVYGRRTGAYEFVKFLETADLEKVGEMFAESAKVLRRKAKEIEKVQNAIRMKKEKASKGTTKTTK
ncbi:MAG: helix-turn-helix domain-containing protein [Lachnospiraceae bacterium]|nr:helix-turn-helix domain-containing protein [Lachnospiraceae bacterium]